VAANSNKVMSARMIQSRVARFDVRLPFISYLPWVKMQSLAKRYRVKEQVDEPVQQFYHCTWLLSTICRNPHRAAKSTHRQIAPHREKAGAANPFSASVVANLRLKGSLLPQE
jgi:hypothetical protein